MRISTHVLSRRRILQILASVGLGGTSFASLIRPHGLQRVDPPDFRNHQQALPMEIMPERTVRYLSEVGEKLASMRPREIAAHVSDLALKDVGWRRQQCLSLRAAEGIMSNNSIQLLASPLATRVTEGFPGDKGFPGESEPRSTDRYIDEVEATIIYFAQKLFHAKYVEWRPISNTMANALPLLALTEPGDVIMAQSMQGGGGNYSYHSAGPGGLKQLTFIDIPSAENFLYDLAAFRALAKEVRPKFIFVGGSYFLFPVQLHEVRQIADEVKAKIVFDAAHVSLLIAGGALPQPLDEGADILTMSTHKIFGGPVGGITMTNDPELARKMLNRTLNGYVQTRDENKYVAAAYAFAEVAEFGAENARQIVQNAQALAEGLGNEGFHPLGKERGHTRTHQVVLDTRDHNAMSVEKKCSDCNIFIETARLPGDVQDWTKRSGLRLGVNEVTRLGMKQKEMTKVAHLIRQASEGGNPSRVAAEVQEFLRDFQTPLYTFSA